ncbi:signal peptidase II [Aureimonas psammosilenae]|uniref:signal peptidase II n=1 Tax=Aureimonas psammosilenae TaxID=2495496 RepID=UPI001F44341E|nr:signal peptidase II [Aureimonas psammosilenae]
MCIVVVSAGAALDLAAKAWARTSLEPYGSAVDFLPFISLRLTFNEGVSFSLLSFDHDRGRLALLAFTGLLTLGFAIWAYGMPRGRERLALSVIIAGALANFLDRAVNGAVTDYLDLHFGDWHPFVFNLADVLISCGAVAIFAMRFMDEGTERRKS